MKKVLFLALMATAFMFGCSAEGVFESAGDPIKGPGNYPRGVDWNKKNETWNCSGPGNGICEE